ncbi:TetR family transcriptional regulator C-terminal domain-containing protein [Nocardia arthritidis]|uniref:TetR family transcriptional regulator C-terminal domain-containing protein n=1 Tax=Nocardia arthritidis TaxID=228602 RepID=UPI003D1613DC
MAGDRGSARQGFGPRQPGREAESRDAAAELLALLDGLAIAVLTEPARVAPERARRIARGWVRAWLG